MNRIREFRIGGAAKSNEAAPLSPAASSAAALSASPPSSSRLSSSPPPFDSAAASLRSRFSSDGLASLASDLKSRFRNRNNEAASSSSSIVTDSPVLLCQFPSSSLPQISSLIADPTQFPALLKFVSSDPLSQQELLFVCEVGQLIARSRQLDSLSIFMHSIKLINLFVRSADSSSGLPCVSSLLPSTRRQLEISIPLKIPSESEMEIGAGEKFDVEVLLTILEIAKEEVETGLGKRIGKRFMDSQSQSQSQSENSSFADNIQVDKFCSREFYFSDLLVDSALYRGFFAFLTSAGQNHKDLSEWYKWRIAKKLIESETELSNELLSEAVAAMKKSRFLRNQQQQQQRQQNRVDNNSFQSSGIQFSSLDSSASLSSPSPSRSLLSGLVSDLTPSMSDLEFRLHSARWPDFCRSSIYKDLQELNSNEIKREYNSNAISNNLLSPERRIQLKSIIQLLKRNKEILVLPLGKAGNFSSQNSPPMNAGPKYDSKSDSSKQKENQQSPSSLISSVAVNDSESAAVTVTVSDSDSVSEAEAEADRPDWRVSKLFDFVCVVKKSAPIKSRHRGNSNNSHSQSQSQVRLLSRFPAMLDANNKFPENFYELCFPTVGDEENPQFADKLDPPPFSFVATMGGESVFGGCRVVGSREEIEFESAPVNEENPAAAVESWDLENFLAGPEENSQSDGEERQIRYRVQYAVCILTTQPAINLLMEALNSLDFVDSECAPAVALAGLIESQQFRRLIAFTRPFSSPIDLFGVRDSPLVAPLIEVSFSVLFDFLHPARVLTIIESLLAERKILLACNSIESLTPICQSIMSLLYPFRWQYPYVPVLPRRLFQYLQCPTPFFMGISRDFVDRASSLISSDCLIVDCDNDEIICRLPLRAENQFPSKFRDQFIHIAKKLYRSNQPPNINLQAYFVEFWANSLKDYRSSCFILPDSTDPILLFDRQNFSQTRENSCQPFVNEFIRSSFWTDFIHTRSQRAVKLLGADQQTILMAGGIKKNRDDAFDWAETESSNGSQLDSLTSNDENSLMARVRMWKNSSSAGRQSNSNSNADSHSDSDSHSRASHSTSFSSLAVPSDSADFNFPIFNLNDFVIGNGVGQGIHNQIDLSKEFIKLT